MAVDLLLMKLPADIFVNFYHVINEIFNIFWWNNIHGFIENKSEIYE